MQDRGEVSVIGTGYLGTTHAACLAEMGLRVLAFDVDAEKIAKLRQGQAPLYEPGLDDLLQKHVASGRLRFTTELDEIGADCEVHFLCVGTPQTDGDGSADTSQIDTAVDALCASIRRDCVIVGKSTVPVGTAERVALRVASACDGADVELAWNPEFLREGEAVRDGLMPERLIFGVDGPRGEATLRNVYRTVIRRGTPVLVTNLATAQIIKVTANSYLAMKISFINAIAEVCDAVDADVTQVASALGLDPRIGPEFLRPGIGFGGGCLPKDIRAFIHRAQELGIGDAVWFLRAVDEINLRSRVRAVQEAEALLDGLAGRTVTALGAAFKPNSDDVRDSPALDVASRLIAAGASVRLYDPAANENARTVQPHIAYCDTVVDAARDSELILILTDWEEFRRLDPVELGAHVAARRVLDGRHALDPQVWAAAGWTYRALGVPSPSAASRFASTMA